MKNLKKVLAALLVVAMLILTNINTNPVSATGFTDVKTNSWYYTYVNRLVTLGITTGIGYNMFAPNKSVTKAEFVTFLCKATGLNKEDNGYSYRDTTTHWGKKWVSAAVTANIIDKGWVFYPNKAITRQEAVEMLCRTLGLSEDTTLLTPYSDVAKDAGYSNRAYEEYLMLGSVTNGKRYFYPSSDIKRSEVAAVIVNLVDYKKDAGSYKAVKKAEVVANEAKANEAKAEADKYQEWKNTLDKGISKELLNNVTGLKGGKTLKECNDYAINELANFTGWMEECKISDVATFKNEFVKAARNFSDIYYNRSYTKIDILEIGLTEYWSPVNVENYLQRTLNDTKNNKMVEQGQLFTGTGLIIFTNDRPLLRGTLKYRYLEPTSTKSFITDICKDTGKPCEYNTWYAVDIEITFSPEDGLRADRVKEISSIRLWR